MSTGDTSCPEARWRNYQHLIWTQQQIHLQIQQQQQLLQSSKPNEIGEEGNPVDETVGNRGAANQQVPDTPEKPAEDKAKEGLDPWDNFDAHAAFLGPTLWDKRLPYDGQDFKLEYVDLEEFLTENGIPVDPVGDNFSKNGSQSVNLGQISQSSNTCAPQPPFLGGNLYMAGPSRSQSHGQNLPQSIRNLASTQSPLLSRSPSPSESSSSEMSQDMTPAVSPDSTQPQGQRTHSSIPGQEFDPRTRAFTDDELKPQPMIKKSRKQFVPDEAKDCKYWARRRKNNMAAKRSRDARRMKENQIAMRACYLEKENMVLKQEMERIQKENTILKEQLSRCHRDH